MLGFYYDLMLVHLYCSKPQYHQYQHSIVNTYQALRSSLHRKREMGKTFFLKNVSRKFCVLCCPEFKELSFFICIDVCLSSVQFSAAHPSGQILVCGYILDLFPKVFFHLFHNNSKFCSNCYKIKVNPPPPKSAPTINDRGCMNDIIDCVRVGASMSERK